MVDKNMDSKGSNSISFCKAQRLWYLQVMELNFGDGKRVRGKRNEKLRKQELGQFFMRKNLENEK